MNQEVVTYHKLRRMVRLAGLLPGMAVFFLAVAPAAFLGLQDTGRCSVEAINRAGVTAAVFFCNCTLILTLLSLIPAFWLRKYREQPVFMPFPDYSRADLRQENRVFRLIVELLLSLFPLIAGAYAAINLFVAGLTAAWYYGLLFGAVGLTAGGLLAAVLRFIFWGRLEFCIADQPLELDSKSRAWTVVIPIILCLAAAAGVFLIRRFR